MAVSDGSKKPDLSKFIKDIENIIASGYSKKEDLRALDKKLREEYSQEIISLRHRWEKVYLNILEAGQPALAKKCKTVIQTLDRVAETINHADYGYAGLFDRVKKIQAELLKQVLDNDRGFAEHLTKLDQDIAATESALSSAAWSVVNATLTNIEIDLRSLEENWDKRKQVMSN
jgi:hypothetical protein